MTKKTVLISTDVLSESIQELIRTVCERLDVVAHFMSARDRTFPKVANAALFVAGLPANERQVPRDVLRILRSFYPATQLLLLSNDALVRPHVCRSGGLLNLVGPPFTGAQLLSRMRMLLADSPWDLAAPGAKDVGNLSVHEQRLPTYWFADLAGRRTTTDSPVWTLAAENHFVGVVSLDGASIPPERVEPVEEVMTKDLSEAALAEALDDHFGLIALRRGADEWTVYWPSHAPLYMVSQSRLPRQFDLAAGIGRTGGRLRQLSAASGDVVVALLETQAPSERDYQAVARNGAASVLERLEGAREGSVHGFLIEVF